MLEIFVVWALTKRIGTIVEEKGRKSGWYKVLAVVLWFGCEFVGAVIGFIVTGGSESIRSTVYIFALLGAAAGAGITFLIAKSLPPVVPVSPTSHPVAVAPGSNLSAGDRAVAKEGKPASNI